MLGALVTTLALLGALALGRRLLGAAGVAVLKAAEMAVASGLAESGARRGDLTAMSEGRQAQRRAQVSRRRSLAVAACYLAWLVVPLLLGSVAEAYAVAAPLWLLPSARRTDRREEESRVGPPSNA